MVKLDGFARYLTPLYNDLLTVRRYKEVKNRDGSYKVVLGKEPIHDKIPCRISYFVPDHMNDDQVDFNVMFLPIKIFCPLEYDIKKGDHITAEKLDGKGNIITEYVGIANLSFIYATHQELYIVQKGKADGKR